VIRAKVFKLSVCAAHFNASVSGPIWQKLHQGPSVALIDQPSYQRRLDIWFDFDLLRPPFGMNSVRAVG
jgi:hypothetical protein